MGLSVGDQITLISPKGNITAFGTVPRMRAYQIIGLFDVGMFEYDSGFIFMPMQAAQTYFRMPDAVTTLEIFIDDPDKAPQMARQLQQTVGSAGRVHDWQRANSSFFNAIQVERNVMFLILTLIIVVAAFNIISSLIMLVKEKGGRSPFCARWARRVAQSCASSSSPGQASACSELCSDSPGAGVYSQYRDGASMDSGLDGDQSVRAGDLLLSQLPAKVDYLEVLAVTAMALTLSFLATIYPSWRAAPHRPGRGAAV